MHMHAHKHTNKRSSYAATSRAPYADIHKEAAHLAKRLQSALGRSGNQHLGGQAISTREVRQSAHGRSEAPYAQRREVRGTICPAQGGQGHHMPPAQGVNNQGLRRRSYCTHRLPGGQAQRLAHMFTACGLCV